MMAVGPSLDPTCRPDCVGVPEVELRSAVDSTNGPVDRASFTCARGHWFFFSVEWLARAVDTQESPCRFKPRDSQQGARRGLNSGVATSRQEPCQVQSCLMSDAPQPIL
jgi:hypothetical protein